ncbi:MAG: hypothetical protein AB4041_02395, partial [Microcystaceae cyanobacterium]
MTHLPDDEPRNNPKTAQEHSGTGNNVGRDKNREDTQGDNIEAQEAFKFCTLVFLRRVDPFGLLLLWLMLLQQLDAKDAQGERNKVDQRDATVYGYAPDGKGNNIVSGQSVSGNVIKIINYYYHEDTQINTEEKVDEYIPCPYRGLYHFTPQDTE